MKKSCNDCIEKPHCEYKQRAKREATRFTIFGTLAFIVALGLGILAAKGF